MPIPFTLSPTQNDQPRDLVSTLRALRDGLLHGLVERDTPVRLALLAALAGEHVLLLGPPGTAKSLLARRLRGVFRGATYFERLLTRFSVPEELFGPLSIQGLQEDRYKRNTAGYLPTASVAFLDEVFKANSAILNSLLTILNEREFDDDGKRHRVPLVSLVGASNELPEGEELHALFDRFLIRCHVDLVSDGAFSRLLAIADEAPAIGPDLQLAVEDLDLIRKAARNVAVPDGVLDLLRELRLWLRGQKIAVSDRRWRKLQALLQVAALTNGRGEVTVWDAWLLPHCLWEKPEQRDAITAWYEERVGVGAASEAIRFPRLVATWERALATEQDSKTHAKDEKGRLLYRLSDGKPVTTKTIEIQKQHANGEPAYLYPPEAGPDRKRGGGTTRNWLRQYVGNENNYCMNKENWLTEPQELPPLFESQRYSAGHVTGRLKAVDLLVRDVDAHIEGLAREIGILATSIDGHLWIEPGFSRVAGQRLNEAREKAVGWRDRLGKVRAGFEGLPREREAIDEETEPEGAEA